MYFLCILVCGKIWISNVSHNLDSVFQKVFQPVDLLGVLLDFLPALQKVVAGHCLSGITFTFFASEQGRDQVHPLAMPLSIPILFVTLTPGTPLAPFAVDGAGFLVASLLIISASLALLTTIDGFLLDFPVPVGNSSSAGGAAQSPVAPFSPDTWAGVGVEGGLGCCHLRLFLVKVFTLHVHLVILLLQELVEHLCQAGDVFVVLVMQNVPDEVQLLSLQGPTPSHLFNFGFNDEQASVKHFWIVTDIVSKHGPVVSHQNIILCPPIVHVSVCSLHHHCSLLELGPHFKFPGILPCGSS